MVPIRPAGAALALAILAVSTPVGRSDAADNQVTEMPDGLKYTDTKIGDGATAKAGNKVSVNYTGWLYNNGAKGRSSTARLTAASRSSSRLARTKLLPVGTRGWPA